MISFRTLKSLFPFVASLLIATSISAQTQRTILIEQETSSSCPNCGSQNPPFDALVLDQGTDVSLIKYQWGDAGHPDIMFDFNPTQTTERVVGYYNSIGFPQVWVNGNLVGVPGAVTQTMIDTLNAQPAWFTIELELAWNAAKDSAFVLAAVEALKDFQEDDDSSLTVHIVLVEKTIVYPTPPGTNTESVFLSVMRNMLLGSSGYTIGKQTNGQVTPFFLNYAIDTDVINTDSLWAVAFVQNANTRQVEQSASVAISDNISLSSPEISTDRTPLQVVPLAGNRLHIVSPQASHKAEQYELVNLTGQSILAGSGNMRNGLTIATPQLAPGVYFFRTESSPAVKFVITQ